MVKCLLTLTCILTTVAVTAAAKSAPSQPPAWSPGATPPAADCSSLIYNMMDCMGFLIIGGTETTPEDSCCSGFKTVLKANADCICYALIASPSLGLDINMTRAAALPSDCGVSAPPISNCDVSASPGGSPAKPPATSAPPLNYPSLPPTTPPPAAAPYSSASSPASQAATSSPAHSGACAVSVTFPAFLVTLVSFLNIQNQLFLA